MVARARPRPSFGLLLLLLLVGWLTPRPAIAEPIAAAMPDDARVCAVLAHAAETALGIPAKLVLAVGVVESGIYDKSVGRAEPWPWTINAEGKGFRFRSKADAIRAVERLKKSGVRSIDVGCMQVNLSYHWDAFADLEEAFDPVMNVAYGAHFLETLHDDRGSWSAAVAAYHSSIAKHGVPYRRKVAKTWIALRGEIEQAVETNSRRARIAAAYREQRAAFEARQAEKVRMQEARRSMRQWPKVAPPDSGILAIRGISTAEPSDEDDPAAKTPDDTAPPSTAESEPEQPPPDDVVEKPQDCIDDAGSAAESFDPALAQEMLEISGLVEPDEALEDAEPTSAAAEITPVCPRVIDATPKKKRSRPAHGVTIIRG